MTNVLYLIGIITAGGLTTAMAIHLWINRKILESDFSIHLMICLWFWITAQIAECIAVPLGLKVVFYKTKFISISLVSIFVLGFALQNFRRNYRVVTRVISGIAVPILAYQLLTFLPSFETSAWARFFISPNNLLLDITPALGYVVINMYNLFLLLAAYAILLAGAFSPRNPKRLKLLPFFSAGLLCSSAAIFDYFLKEQIFFYRTTPIALSLSSLSVVYYLRLRYSRTIPLAQHAVSQSMMDALIILNPQNDIIYANPAAFSLFRRPAETVIGRPLEAFVGGLAPFLIEDRAGSEDERDRTTLIGGKPFDVSLSVIHSRRGKPLNKIIILRDISRLVRVEQSLRELTNELERKVAERTSELEESNRALREEVEERKKAEERLKISLNEKSILLGELHHRVKNNLQVVSSLLKLQSYYINDPEARDLFTLSVSRIRSMAMVHEKLYRSDDLAHTHFGQYLHELVHSVILSYARTTEAFALTLAIDPIDLDTDKSILSGLIVNELVMNSIKHAFPDPPAAGRTGKNEIFLSFRIENGDYVIEYCDNGTGLPTGLDFERSDSLGMKIIATLVKQLKGTIETPPHAGMRAIIRFPVNDRDAKSNGRHRQNNDKDVPALPPVD